MGAGFKILDIFIVWELSAFFVFFVQVLFCKPLVFNSTNCFWYSSLFYRSQYKKRLVFN